MAFYQLGVIIANLHGQPDFFTQENGEVIDKSVHVYTFGSGYLQDVNWAWKLDSYDIYFGIFCISAFVPRSPFCSMRVYGLRVVVEMVGWNRQLLCHVIHML